MVLLVDSLMGFERNTPYLEQYLRGFFFVCVASFLFACSFFICLFSFCLRVFFLFAWFPFLFVRFLFCLQHVPTS